MKSISKKEDHPLASVTNKFNAKLRIFIINTPELFAITFLKQYDITEAQICNSRQTLAQQDCKISVLFSFRS